MKDIFELINGMSPYLLLGFLIAGVMHAFLPGKLYSRYLSKDNMRSVLNAALLGIPLPLCSCGVIPAAMSLKKEGASDDATVSFLIATPQTGVDSLLATYSLMGLPFALLRPVAALVTALFGGGLVNRVCRGKAAMPADPDLEKHHCCRHGDADHGGKMSFAEKVKEALRYGLVDMVGDIGRWLVIGLVAAAVITVAVPADFFEPFAGNPMLSMLLVLAIAVPMYLCATGSIPIAVALMLKGLTPGAALVMLMAGPACNVASILVLGKSLGRRAMWTYLAAIIVGAVGFGLIVDYCLPLQWFTGAISGFSCHGEDGGGWFSIACTVTLVLLLINAWIRTRRHNVKSCCSHCS